MKPPEGFHAHAHDRQVTADLIFAAVRGLRSKTPLGMRAPNLAAVAGDDLDAHPSSPAGALSISMAMAMTVATSIAMRGSATFLFIFCTAWRIDV